MQAAGLRKHAENIHTYRCNVQLINTLELVSKGRLLTMDEDAILQLAVQSMMLGT